MDPAASRPGYPINQIAEAVVDAALSPEGSSGKIQLLPTELIIRRSCGC